MNPQIGFLLDRALESLRSSNLESAEIYLKQALRLQSSNPHVLRLLGVISALRRDYIDALKYLNTSLKNFPKNPLALSNLGNVYLELEEYSNALDAYDKSLKIDSKYEEAWSNKGNALYGLKRFDEALVHHDRALSLKPGYAEAWSNKGNVLNELKRFDEAIAHYDRALSLNPNYAEGWYNKGNALTELKQCEEAMAYFDNAISLKQDYHEAWLSKGAALQELKRYDEAIAHFDRALTLKPDYAQAALNKATLNLYLKKYQAGWENYDWRLKTKDFQVKMAIEDLEVWSGSQCKHLLVFAEQGVGDIIFYASLLGIIKNKVGNITVVTDRRLTPILSRSFPEITFIDSSAPLDVASYDAQIPFASLPVILDMAPDMVGRSVPYLVDNDEFTKILQHRTRSSKQLKCGVAWKSNNNKLGKNKSVLLSELKEILRLDGYEFINLQYGDTREEIIDLEENNSAKLTTIDGIDLFNDIDGLLSIIQTCDLIVTTSNITAHLAGALGKKTLLLVPYSTGRIWYWHEEEISSWYPSITLYSQDQNFEWNGAIRDIASKLKNEIFK